MDERRLTTILASLLRESGHLESGAGGALDVAAGLARDLLATLPSLAALADPVATEIVAGAEQAAVRLGVPSERTEVPGASEGGVASLLDELRRVPDGPALVGSLQTVLSLALGTLGGSPESGGASPLDIARLSAAVADALCRAGERDEPLLFVRGRLTGIRAHLFGLADAHIALSDMQSQVGRRHAVAALEKKILRRVLAAGGTDTHSVLTSGGGLFLVLLPHDDETLERITQERARLELDLLRETEAEIGLTLTWVTAGEAVLTDGAALFARLDQAERDRSRTPFLDALGEADVFGPFGSGMVDEAEIRAAFDEQRRVGNELRSAQFGVEVEGWPPRTILHGDAQSLGEAAGDVVRIEWFDGLETLHAGLEASAACGGRLLFEPSPLALAPADLDESGPLAAVQCRVRVRPEESARVTLLRRLSQSRAVHELVRTGAAALAREQSVTLLFGAGAEFTALGPVRSILEFTSRSAALARRGLGADVVDLNAGIAVVRENRDLTRLLREAAELLDRASGLSEPGGTRCFAGGATVVFGADVATGELGKLTALGEDLVSLAAEQPGPVLTLLEGALRIGRGGEDIPLSSVATLRARIHELVARLGLNASALHDSNRDDHEDTHMRALRSLIRSFPRMFGSGAARVPLAYAVLLSQCHTRELRT